MFGNRACRLAYGGGLYNMKAHEGCIPLKASCNLSHRDVKAAAPWYLI